MLTVLTMLTPKAASLVAALRVVVKRGVAARCSMAILPKHAIGLAVGLQLHLSGRCSASAAGVRYQLVGQLQPSLSLVRPAPLDELSASTFHLSGRKKLTIDFAGGNQSSDGGLLLLRAAERKLGV